MISTVRKYTNEQVLKVDPKFREWKDAFNISNIPSNIYDQAFHFIYTAASMSRAQGLIDLSIAGTLTLFYKADRNVQDTYDQAQDTANEVALTIGNLHNIENYQTENNLDNPIQGVEVISVTAAPPATNDNRVIITIEILFGMTQSTC